MPKLTIPADGLPHADGFSLASTAWVDAVHILGGAPGLRLMALMVAGVSVLRGRPVELKEPVTAVKLEGSFLSEGKRIWAQFENRGISERVVEVRLLISLRAGPAPRITEEGERIPPAEGSRPCDEYDPAGPGAGKEADGHPQCAGCGHPKTKHSKRAQR